NASQTFYSSTGEERHVLYYVAPLPFETESLAIAVTVDVTEQEMLSRNNAELQERIRLRSRDLQHLDEMLRKRQNLVQKVQSQMEILEKTFEHVSEGIYITDANHNVLSINQAFTNITGYKYEEIKNDHTNFLRADLHPREFYDEIDRRLEKEHYWEGELWGRHKSGTPYPLYLILTGITDREGTVTHYIGVIQDRSEIHQSRIELEHETLHDSLTKLPNKVLFLDRLTVACKQAEESHSSLAVLLLGLDRFSNVNKSLGYSVGDELLLQAASRMEEILPEAGTLARFGGDEFVAFIPFTKNPRQALRSAEELIESIRRPFFLGEHEVRITVSGGISIYPQDTENAETLLKNASLALGRAKQESRNWYQLFTEDLNEHMQIRHDVEKELRKGISEQEFFMYYQPKIHATTKRIVGSEALMRWIRPGKGIISPVTFIPLAEEIGEIVALGRVAMSTACKQVREWNIQGHQLHVAVNVSPQQFSDNAFSASVLEAMEKAQVDPAMVELEITESAFMTNLTKAVRIMKDLQKEGVRFSLDDFGTGYSSLSYIHHLPLSGIKVDRSLTFDLHTNENTRAIISTLVFMARELGLELTVEGVETQEQLRFIQSLGEDLLVQGYLFSPPLPPEEFLRYLQKSVPAEGK
ncbi:MAG TPA: EAL domain-containing protein, partial [Synergistaceae bacterium]|nr:EAL domain-containing protein [Synergistaceae bacterium]